MLFFMCYYYRLPLFQLICDKVTMLSSLLVKNKHCPKCLPADPENASYIATRIIREYSPFTPEFIKPCFLERNQKIGVQSLQDILYTYFHTNLAKITTIVYRGRNGNPTSREIVDFTKSQCSISNLELPITVKNTLLFNLLNCPQHRKRTYRNIKDEKTTRYIFQSNPEDKDLVLKLDPSRCATLYTKYHTAPTATLLQARIRIKTRRKLAKNFLNPVKTWLNDYTVIEEKYKYRLVLTKYTTPVEQKPFFLSQ